MPQTNAWSPFQRGPRIVTGLSRPRGHVLVETVRLTARPEVGPEESNLVPGKLIGYRHIPESSRV